MTKAEFWDLLAFLCNDVEDYQAASQKITAAHSFENIHTALSRDSELGSLLFKSQVQGLEHMYERAEITQVKARLDGLLAVLAAKVGMTTADFSNMNAQREMVNLEALKKMLLDNQEFAKQLQDTMLTIQAALLAMEKTHELQQRLGAANTRQDDGGVSAANPVNRKRSRKAPPEPQE